MRYAADKNDYMHSIVRGIVEQMHGVYKQGPLKKKERVEEKVRLGCGVVALGLHHHTLMHLNTHPCAYIPQIVAKS